MELVQRLNRQSGAYPLYRTSFFLKNSFRLDKGELQEGENHIHRREDDDKVCQIEAYNQVAEDSRECDWHHPSKLPGVVGKGQSVSFSCSDLLFVELLQVPESRVRVQKVAWKYVQKSVLYS
jgi:hypothetical protein